MGKWIVGLSLVAGAALALLHLLRGRQAPAFATVTTTEPVPWPEIPADPTEQRAPVASRS